MNYNKKHRAEVLEIYPSEGKAAIRFSYRNRQRIESIKLYMGSDCKSLVIGMKGWATYIVSSNMGIWGFTPFKTER